MIGSVIAPQGAGAGQIGVDFASVSIDMVYPALWYAAICVSAFVWRQQMSLFQSKLSRYLFWGAIRKMIAENSILATVSTLRWN